MKFENALLFFQHLIGLDEAKMRENLSQLCPKEAPIFAETLALIDAHYANQQRSGFTPLSAEAKAWRRRNGRGVFRSAK